MEISGMKKRIDEIDSQIGELYREKHYLEQAYWGELNKKYGGAITASAPMDSEDNLDEFFRDWDFMNRCFYYGSYENKKDKSKDSDNNAAFDDEWSGTLGD